MFEKTKRNEFPFFLPVPASCLLKQYVQCRAVSVFGGSFAEKNLLCNRSKRQFRRTNR